MGGVASPKPVHREGFSDPLPVERLMMRECPFSTKTREVLGNPSPPSSRFPTILEISLGRRGWISQYLPHFGGARIQSILQLHGATSAFDALLNFNRNFHFKHPYDGLDYDGRDKHFTEKWNTEQQESVNYISMIVVWLLWLSAVFLSIFMIYVVCLFWYMDH